MTDIKADLHKILLARNQEWSERMQKENPQLFTELANEHPRWEGGLFTTAVLRALQAKADKPGLITTHQMFANMKDFMLDEVRKYHLTSQTPLIQDLGYGGDAKTPPAASQGEFVFVSGR